MNHSHQLLSRFAGGLLFLLSLCLVPSFAQIVFDGSPGTAAPPSILGPYTMTPFAADGRPLGNNETSVATPGVCGANNIGFGPALTHRRIGPGFNDWKSWSHGYTGDVYQANGNNATIFLPPGTAAFYLYAEPNNFGAFTIQATANDGTTLGPIPVQGNAGAQYYGFYTTGPAALSSITIESAGGAGGFAIGEFAISCQAVQAITSLPNDQKAGSFLVFPYYTSEAVTGRDTRITLSNIGSLARALIHVFLIDGRTCNQADFFTCLTPNASFSFKASEYDPENTGFIYAVAVNSNTGIPVRNNVLIGNAFVQDGIYVGNYNAESFWSYGTTQGGAFDPIGQTAILALGSAYDGAPTDLSVEVQSPMDKANQKLVVAPVAGDLTYTTDENLLFTAAAHYGTGQVFNEQEKGASYSNLLVGTCLRTGIISDTHPRVPFTMGNLIRSGQMGSLKFRVTAGVGLLMTPRDSSNTWTGIRSLHKTATRKAIIQIPVFAPVC
ncbi:MAG: hypothetical protein JST84_18635 [Acidobacteria bacterium]|nr:hypothetical protein [Acidobacteriota bacterium]